MLTLRYLEIRTHRTNFIIQKSRIWRQQVTEARTKLSVSDSYRSADVSWYDGNEGRCEKASASAPQLLCEEVGGDGCEAREDWRQEDANVPDVDGQVEWVKDVVDGTGGEHQARVHSASDNTPQGVPRSLVEPVEEVVEPMLYHVGCRPVVEPENLNAIRWKLNVAVVKYEDSVPLNQLIIKNVYAY